MIVKILRVITNKRCNIVLTLQARLEAIDKELSKEVNNEI